MPAQAQPRARSRIPANVIVLGIVSLLTDASSEMMYPLVPIFVGLLGSGAVVLGVIEGVSESTAAILKLVFGVMSDKFQRKKAFVLLGYTISSLVRPLTGLVGSAWQIVLVRMTDRVGKGIRSAPRDALVAASVDESIRGKAFGFHRAMDHAGAVVGPLLALLALVLVFTVFKAQTPLQALRWTFLLSIVPGLLAVLTVLFFVRDRDVPSSGTKSLRSIFRSFDPNLMRYLGVVTLFTLGNSSDAFLLFRVQEALDKSGAAVSLVNHSETLQWLVARFGSADSQKLAVDILVLPLVWSFFHVLKSVLSTPLGALSDRIGRKRVIRIGWLIYAAVYLGFAVLEFAPAGLQLLFILALFTIYSAFYAFTEGAEKALVADLVPADVRGSAYGAYNLAIGIGALPASVLFGLVYSAFGVNGGVAAFSMGAGIAVTAVVLLTVLVREGRTSGV